MMPQQNQTHEAVASLKLELVAAIRGAFEVAVELAVREVTDLVGQTTDKYLEVMRQENECLRQRWMRGKSYVDPLTESIVKPATERGRSGAGENSMDPGSDPTQQHYSNTRPCVVHHEEENNLGSSDEDVTIGYSPAEMVCPERIETTIRNMTNYKQTESNMINVKQEKSDEDNCSVKMEEFSLKREPEEIVFDEWTNIKPRDSDIQVPSYRHIEERTAGIPPQADTSGVQMLPVITGSFLQGPEVHIPSSAIHSINDPLGQTVNSANLTQSKRTTSPFRCSICYRGFNHMMNLKTHLRIHTGERPYTCPICSRCFRHSNALTRHVRIHTGEKPYNCGWCEKTFRHLAGLKIHQRSHK